jgi:hypothetical protein
MEAIEKYLQSVGHFNLLEIKKNSSQGVWKRLGALMIARPNLAKTKWMKKLAWNIIHVSCIAGGKVMEPLLEDEQKRSKALKFIGPIAFKFLFFQLYSKTKFLNIFLKILMFSFSQI